MNVRCKVKCVTKSEHNGGFHSLVFEPVTTGSEENKQFYKWTPSGQFSFNTINPSAAEQFTPGKEYYLEFSPAGE